MAFSWYVEKEGRQLGPYSSAQLKQLASSGQLRSDDPVRRADRAKVVAAGKVKGLFPEDTPSVRQAASPTSPPPNSGRPLDGAEPAPTPEGMPPPLPSDKSLLDGLGAGLRSFGEASKAAARLAAAQARKTHLEKVILPAAYGALGRDTHASGRFREEFPDLYAGIGDCERQIEQVTSARPQTGPPRGLADRAAGAAAELKVKVQAKTLSLKKESLLRRLGEATFARHGGQCGPEPLVQPILDGLEKVESLDGEILRASKIGGGSLVTPGRILVGAVGIGLATIFFAASVMRGPNVGSTEGANATDGVTGGVTEEVAAGAVEVPDFSKGRRPLLPPDKPSAAGAVEVPDFSKVDYTYDFSKDNYEAVPPGSTRRKRSKSIEQSDLDEIDARNPGLIGKWADEEGYTDAGGRFVRHGRRVIWSDGDRREKYREDQWLDGVRHGLQINWHRGGVRAGEVTFVKGELHGKIRHWYKGGQRSIEASYLHGKQHGLRTEWYPNGQKELEVAYVNDQAHGLLRAWYEDGKPKEESRLVNGKYEGMAKVWGQRSRQADLLNYRGGKLHGLVSRHTRDGLVLGTAAYKDGVLLEPTLDVRTTTISEFMGKMELGSVLTQRSRETFRVIWWRDAWFEMFGEPRAGSGSSKWTYVCSDGIIELVNRPVQEGEGQDGQILVSVYNGLR